MNNEVSLANNNIKTNNKIKLKHKRNVIKDNKGEDEEADKKYCVDNDD